MYLPKLINCMGTEAVDRAVESLIVGLGCVCNGLGSGYGFNRIWLYCVTAAHGVAIWR